MDRGCEAPTPRDVPLVIPRAVPLYFVAQRVPCPFAGVWGPQVPQLIV